MEIKKEKTVCFTGHRPEKFSAASGNGTVSLEMIKSMLYYQIYQAAEEGFDCFITGMARGVDIWAAMYVIELKKKFPQIKLICAKPYKSHGSNFKGNDLWDLKNIISNADNVICVSEEYSKDCYRKRNCYMVDNSSRLIAVVEKYRSGTGQTINYARRKGIDIKIINAGDYSLKKHCEKLKDSTFLRFE